MSEEKPVTIWRGEDDGSMFNPGFWKDPIAHGLREYRALPVAAFDAMVADLARLRESSAAVGKAAKKLLESLHGHFGGEDAEGQHPTRDAMDRLRAALSALAAKDAHEGGTDAR